jgi:hypothetical protein
MSRSRVAPMWGTAGTIAVGALVFACAPPPGPFVTPPGPTQVVSIQIAGCETDYVSIFVNPWTAYVRRGQSVRWTTPGPAEVDSVAIEPVHAHLWPFPWGQADDGQSPEQQGLLREELQRPGQVPPGIPRRSAAAGDTIPSGPLSETALPGQRYRYRILVYCGARVIDIDPDVMPF